MARKPPGMKPASALMPGLGGAGAPKPRRPKMGQGIGVPKVPTGGLGGMPGGGMGGGMPPMGMNKGGLIGGKKKVTKKTAKPPRKNDGKLSGPGWGYIPPWKKNQGGKAPAGSGPNVKGASPKAVRMARGGVVGKGY